MISSLRKQEVLLGGLAPPAFEVGLHVIGQIEWALVERETPGLEGDRPRPMQLRHAEPGAERADVDVALRRRDLVAEIDDRLVVPDLSEGALEGST
jgi:hypothetical protein